MCDAEIEGSNSFLKNFKIPKKNSKETVPIVPEKPRKEIPFSSMKLKSLNTVDISSDMQNIASGAVEPYCHLLELRAKRTLTEKDYMAVAEACVMLEELAAMEELGETDYIQVYLKRTQREDVYETHVNVSNFTFSDVFKYLHLVLMKIIHIEREDIK